MKKKLLSLLVAVLFVVGICFVPDTDAGTSVLNVTNSTYNVEAGKSFTIKLNGIKAKNVKWSSSNKSVAKVNNKGVVKGIKKGKATITGKYKKLKFKVTVTVTKKGQSTYNTSDLVVKFKSAKMTKDFMGDECWAITFTFTNKSSTPTFFSENFFDEAFVNNMGIDTNSTEGTYTKIKSGASLDVTFYYAVKSGDKVDFTLYTYDKNYDKVIVYETSKKIN